MIRDKMQGLSSILSIFRHEFNKFNITGVSQTIKLLLKNHTLWREHVIILPSYTQRRRLLNL